MQTTVNEKFVTRRTWIGAAAMLLGFVALIAGAVVSALASPQSGFVILPWISLGLALFLLNIGKFYQARYGLRPDRALTQALKGLDGKYHLFSFIKTLPTEHLLTMPNGVVVLEMRPFVGEVHNDGDHWSRPANPSGFLHLFSDGALGNPTKDALLDVAAVQKVLRERLGDSTANAVPVFPLIVFTNQRVKLKVVDPAVPVVMLADLRSALRKLREGPRMPMDVQRQLARALEANQDHREDGHSTSRSNSWQRTQKSTPK